MKAITYLSFPGNCQEALKFYETAIGARIKYLSLFRGSPMESDVPPEMRDKVLHAVLDIAGDTLMASDSMGDKTVRMGGFAITLNSETPAETERLFAALAPGGTVTMPLQETFWAKRFGMLVDRYGLPWMFNCEKPMA